jgi:hypothetical protein
MAKVDAGPKGMSLVSWFYQLVHEELKRQRRLLKHKVSEEIPTDETKTLPEDAERAKEGATAGRHCPFLPSDPIPEVLALGSWLTLW